jgi:hypothetical protein
MAGGAIALAVAALAAGRKLVVPPPAATLKPQVVGPVRMPLVIALGVLGTAAFVAEGAATDWAGVHATRVLGASPATASLVYLAFFVAMTAVRFVGDAVRTRLGPATTIGLAGGTATAGYALVLLSGLLPRDAGVGCALAGWTLAGAGVAVVWPIVTSTLGAAGGARRLSAVTTISYGGGLVGPALIGSVAASVTLPVALLIPAALALTVAAVAPSVVRAVRDCWGAVAADSRAQTPAASTGR